MQRLFQRRRQYGVATDDVTGRATPTAPSAPATSARETFPSGIKLLHEPENAIIDIVFVHGLMGDREMTWTAHDTSEPWPKALLPSELPTARVLTFGYDAYVADWRGVVSQNRIANHAWNLLTSLATHREKDESNERPILFVCHSLGGLVCEDALVTARQRSERHIQDILQSTRGIAFLGTPHHGAGLAKWAERLSKSIGIITQTNSEIIEVLQRESEVLARIQDGFHNMVMARNTEGQPIEISCFFEELPLQGIGQVVPQHSAILPGYIPIGIHGNHMDMTKFASKDDPGFVAVCGELRRWIREISRVGRQNLATPSTVDTGRSAIPEDSPTPTTPLLLIAAMLPNSEELERALRMAPDVNIREDHPPGRSALHMAAIFNQPGNISLLLRSGVNRHATTDQGYTPLMAACIAGSTEAVKVLLEEGDQDPNWRDLHQNTPLHAAAVNGHSGVIRELLDHGADPFATTEDGWTPLTVASFTQNAQMTQMLTEAMQAMQANNTTNIS